MGYPEFLFGGIGILLSLGLAALYANQKKLIYVSYFPEVSPSLFFLFSLSFLPVLLGFLWGLIIFLVFLGIQTAGGHP